MKCMTVKAEICRTLCELFSYLAIWLGRHMGGWVDTFTLVAGWLILVFFHMICSETTET